MEKWIVAKCEVDTFNVGETLTVFGSREGKLFCCKEALAVDGVGAPPHNPEDYLRVGEQGKIIAISSVPPFEGANYCQIDVLSKADSST